MVTVTTDMTKHATGSPDQIFLVRHRCKAPRIDFEAMFRFMVEKYNHPHICSIHLLRGLYCIYICT